MECLPWTVSLGLSPPLIPSFLPPRLARRSDVSVGRLTHLLGLHATEVRDELPPGNADPEYPIYWVELFAAQPQVIESVHIEADGRHGISRRPRD